MSKENLQKALDTTQVNNYAWSLYFISIDRRKKQPYFAYKIRFKNKDYITTYATSLMASTLSFQLSPIEKVQDYDGENSKVSCDKLSVVNPLIEDQWKNLQNAIATSSGKKIESRINACVLDGTPKFDDIKPLCFIKFSNPITNLVNKKSVVFKHNANDELDIISDDVCRLYLTTDIIVYDKVLYTFNLSFENFFNLEKTMDKLKLDSVDTILKTDVFTDKDLFETLANQYKSSRTFITLKPERIERIKDETNRIKIAGMLKIPLDSSNKLNIANEEQTSLIIRYLCFKILQDEETKNIFEITSAHELSI